MLAAETAATLAVRAEQADLVWPAVQRLFRTNNEEDAYSAGRATTLLRHKGFLGPMPWLFLATSPAARLRHLAAALLPYEPPKNDSEVAVVMDLAADDDPDVRLEIARALPSLMTSSPEVGTLITKLLAADPWFHIRSRAVGGAEPQ